MDFLNHVTNIFFIKKNEDINFSKLKNPFRPAVKKKEFQEFDEKINSFIPAVNECISYLRNVRLKNNNRIVIESLEKDYLNKYYELIFSGLNTNYKTEIKKEFGHISE
jgi:conjugal transfer ATP-binding protein TraC